MALNVMSMLPDEAVDAILHLWSHECTRRQTVLLHGEPGVGKSAIVTEVARLLDAQLIDLRLMQLDPTDLRGLVMVDTETKTTRHYRPEFLPEYTADPNAARVVILLDEIMAAPDLLRKAAFELILDRRVGPHRLGTNVFVIAAGNTVEDGTNIHELDTATADRFLHIRIETSVDAWLAWAARSRMHPHVISFVKNNPALFRTAQSDIELGLVATPSPRSYERVSEILYSNPPRHLRDAMITGWLGEGAANQLLTLLDDADSKFDLEQLLRAPAAERRYPQTPFGQYSLAHNLAAWITDAESFDTAWSVMLEMPEEVGHAAADCKLQFVNLVGPKMIKLKLISKYASDPRTARFRAEQDAILAGRPV